jgi:chemotaxis protein MotB
MALSRRSRQPSSINIWPGFVDALTQLVMVFVFVLLVFTVGQFYLSGAVSDQDIAIKKLTQQLNSLTDILGLERKSNDELKLDRATLTANLKKADAERDRINGALADATTRGDQAVAADQDKARQLSEQEVTLATLNQNINALREQLTQLEAALDLAQAKNKDDEVKIADLGTKLNLALATKVEELARYRSDFFGRLKEILGDRPDIRIVGDRFVFQSEVLFTPASADLGDPARKQLSPVVNALREIQSKIPPGLNWILEVDGHTDSRAINTPTFQSNWELSTARAVSVVKFLIEQGIPSEHLSAAGFGEWQPLDRASSDDAYRRNRRIELKLTQR